MIRVIVAVLLGIAAVAAVWWLPARGFAILVMVVSIAGLVEYAKMFFSDVVEGWMTVAAGVIAAAGMLWCPLGAEGAVITIVILTFAMSLFFMWRAKELPGVAGRLALSMFGVLYLGVAFPMWGWLREMDFGRQFVLLALVPACLCDTFAFLAGRIFGRHKFAPQTSPNKTMEGFAGALAGSLIGTFLVKWLIFPVISVPMAILFAVVIWFVSPFGDLVESLLKRSSGVKDSGHIIPGHGGILDRLDALVFTGPAAYVFARYVLSL